VNIVTAKTQVQYQKYHTTNSVRQGNKL